MRYALPYLLSPFAAALLSAASLPAVGRAGGADAALQCRVTFVPSPDTDGDGLVDATESWMGTDPNCADTDGDKLPDGWEAFNQLSPLRSVGDDGAFGDPDGDGFVNIHEYAADTHPRDPSSLLRITSIARHESMMRLTWQGGTWAWQYLEATVSADLNGGWQPLLVRSPPTSTFAMAYDPDATNAVRFYRIRATREAP